MFWRMMKSVTLVGAAWVAVTTLPDVARYLRIRAM